VIVGLTEESRISWYNPLHKSEYKDPEWNKHIHATWLRNSKDPLLVKWQELHKHYLNTTDCIELYQLNYETTVRLFDSISLKYNITLVQFNAMATTTLSNCDTLYDFNSKYMLDNKSNVYNRYGHPNEHGHQLISQKLIKIIDSIAQDNV
jgi:hypothetical protein